MATRMTPRLNNILKDKLIELFDYYGLKLKINCNVKIVNFLDITLNLNTGTYHPYMKPNNTIRYINNSSNHPPATIKNIAKNINNRLSRNSANEDIFNASVQPYKKALEESGHKAKLKYNTNAKIVNNRNRR